MFSDLAAPPLDPILGLSQLLARDPSPDKVDLGIGIYHDETGHAAVPASVKRAEAWLLETQRTKRYLSSAGNPAYNEVIRALILGPGAATERARTIQAPGGTGALRLAADFLRRMRPAGRVLIPAPTWANHPAILKSAGLEPVPYPYYDVASGALRFEEMMEFLAASLRPEDTLLLHGCCQNPAGADPSPAQWEAIAGLLERTGAMPLVDLAYQGFGDGLDEDARAVRMLAARLPEMLVASSCSKNFALYRERVGALTVMAATPEAATVAHAHFLPVARTLWSMPPDHGAAVVAHVLGDAALRREWTGEVTAMRERINGMRRGLVERLAGRSARDFGYLARQRGMFALLGIGPEAVERLRSEHHVHVTTTGRANVAGLTTGNLDHVADAIAAIA